ncbi:MAG: PAS domain S-box protein [Verrucomicrobia bacterium]|nr:PAS domain S-box protein [Verrucomicrobiota bacterium]
MSKQSNSSGSGSVLDDNQNLRLRLAEAEQTLEAIRSGGVDALVASVNGEERIFTLKGEDRSYRILIEAMDQGALITSTSGLIMYANHSFAGMLKAPLEKVIGSLLADWIMPQSQAVLTSLLSLTTSAKQNSELMRKAVDNTEETVLLSAGKQGLNEESGHLWMAVTDLSKVIARKIKEAKALAQLSIDKKLAEAAIARASYSRSLIEASLDPLVTISADGNITDVNEASVQITGRLRSELIGTDFSGYFTDPDAAHKGYEQVFTEGFVKDYPLAIRSSDGHVTDVLYNASLYRDEKGRVKGVFAAARDITERKKAEMTASRLAAIVESSDDAILGLELDGTITNWNHGAQQLYGYSASEMIGASNLKLIPPEFHAEERHIQETIGRGESVLHIDTERLTKQGKRIHVSLTASPIKNDLGQVIGFSKVTHDISERKQAESEILKLNSELENSVKERTLALTVSEERLRMATVAADIGIWDLDLHTNKVSWDKLMFSIYGMPETADRIIRYEDWKNRVHPDDVEKQEASLLKIIETRGHQQREFRIIRNSDKAIRIIRASDAAIIGEDGQTVRLVGINVDITEVMERVQEIRNLNTSLANRAEELEASVKELDSFSYSVSHDLRAPLRAIDGFSRIVEEDYAPKLDDEGRRLIGVIRGEAHRMGRLIDDLLAFSRLGRQKVEPVTIDMGTMAQQVFQELAATEPGRTIHLNLHPIPPALGTEAMIKQLWINLIGNAVKFTMKREVAEIEIGVMPGEQGEHGDEGEQIYFIRDNGAGFDMRYIEKLFGVFQRLHSKEEFPGTGVGLSLVQRIVNRHGGRVWAKGEVEKGATFFFTIPAVGKQSTSVKEPSTKSTL